MPSKTLAALAAAAIMLAGAGTADAHTLSKARAAGAAFDAAGDYAEASISAVEYVDDILVRNCYRLSWHRVGCSVQADIRTYEGYEYDDGTTAMFCAGIVYVRFASRYSYRLVTRVTDVECF
jgi:hypothetical protein